MFTSAYRRILSPFASALPLLGVDEGVVVVVAAAVVGAFGQQAWVPGALGWGVGASAELAYFARLTPNVTNSVPRSKRKVRLDIALVSSYSNEIPDEQLHFNLAAAKNLP
jgi:hypothetical protein